MGRIYAPLIFSSRCCLRTTQSVANSEKQLVGFDVDLPSLRRKVAIFLVEGLYDLADPSFGESTSESQC